MVALTVLIHLVGLGSLLLLLRAHDRRLGGRRAVVSQSLLILAVVMGLFALHTAEIWAYAALYLELGALSDFEQALYFSTSTYASIGYGDVTLAKPWRVLGAFEGANGVILLGWSTAFFISVITRIRTVEAGWRDR